MKTSAWRPRSFRKRGEYKLVRSLFLGERVIAIRQGQVTLAFIHESDMAALLNFELRMQRWPELATAPDEVIGLTHQMFLDDRE